MLWPFKAPAVRAAVLGNRIPASRGVSPVPTREVEPFLLCLPPLFQLLPGALLRRPDPRRRRLHGSLGRRAGQHAAEPHCPTHATKRGRAAAAAVSLAAVSRGQGRRQGGNAHGAIAVETRRAHTTAEASTRLRMPSSRASPLMRKLNSPLPFIAHDSCASGSRSQRRGRAPAHHCVPCAPAPRVALSAAPQRGQPPPSLRGQSPGGAAASGQLAGRGGGSGVDGPRRAHTDSTAPRAAAGHVKSPPRRGGMPRPIVHPKNRLHGSRRGGHMAGRPAPEPLRLTERPKG